MLVPPTPAATAGHPAAAHPVARPRSLASAAAAAAEATSRIPLAPLLLCLPPVAAAQAAAAAQQAAAHPAAILPLQTLALSWRRRSASRRV